jgi:hypothetical protein
MSAHFLRPGVEFSRGGIFSTQLLPDFPSYDVQDLKNSTISSF